MSDQISMRSFAAQTTVKNIFTSKNVPRISAKEVNAEKYSQAKDLKEQLKKKTSLPIAL
jgi:hypothetical protein